MTNITHNDKIWTSNEDWFIHLQPRIIAFIITIELPFIYCSISLNLDLRVFSTESYFLLVLLIFWLPMTEEVSTNISAFSQSCHLSLDTVVYRQRLVSSCSRVRHHNSTASLEYTTSNPELCKYTRCNSSRRWAVYYLLNQHLANSILGHAYHTVCLAHISM